ncbi:MULTISPECIES: phosphoserine phosphatase SerB [Vitreoscilla]|uniref:Phosphoserine phosphatase n=1 Tax=Vitreoscilla stercoraria TaxID=61 RepID=A0ABY4E994_VITST|nr:MULTISPECIES: phosphoserine phosphatase SerB [Vitreoscilla]AUZ04376.1 phosphoserine phosphatase SerB [Vitreoscilla sp. C1]UOO91896.1 phosphoserine phosphatase SerB [Vitreoscilla stercoraria]
MAVLVLQHPNLTQLDWQFWSDTFTPNNQAPSSVWRISVNADFKLTENQKIWLLQHQVDAAIMPTTAKFTDLGLVVSDMDSTLITIECIDEVAAGNGLKDQVAAITERSMRGELDFEASLRQRVALLKGLPEMELAYVYDHVLQLNRGAEAFLAHCKQHDVKFMLVSGGFTFFTEHLKKRLGFEYAYANELEIVDGKLTGNLTGRLIDAQAKADLLHQYANELNIPLSQTLAMGDGANDIPMLQAAGFGVAIHAKPKTREHADICIDFGGLDAIYHCFNND